MKLNGKDYEHPTQWNQIKTRHYQRMVREWERDQTGTPIELEDRDYFKLFQILTDSEFGGFRDTIENQVKIESAVAWVVFENFSFSEELPKALEFEGRQIEIPSNLKQLSIGANIKARQALDKGLVLVDQNGKLVNCDCYSTLVAIYLQPELNPHPKGGFNWAKAQELEKIIAEMPIYLIRPIGFFLLKRVWKYGSKPEKIWLQTLNSLIRKLRRMLLGWLKFKGSSHTLTYH